MVQQAGREQVYLSVFGLMLWCFFSTMTFFFILICASTKQLQLFRGSWGGFECAVERGMDNDEITSCARNLLLANLKPPLVHTGI